MAIESAIDNALADFQHVLQQRIDEKLSSFISQQETAAASLSESMRYSLFAGGKRMRPLLLSLVGEMLGAQQSDLDVASMAIECVHAYSLIHDDLPAMDDDALRRGKPTNHIKFGEATAILAGDALQTLAFEIVLNQPLSDTAEKQRLQITKILAKASGLNGMCAGQSIDLSSTGKEISLAELTKLHQLKTGALLQACVAMGACMAGETDEQHIRHLELYATKIGLAYQVQDDILDVISDSETLGKPQGSDSELDKNTFVSHLGLEGSQSFLQNLHNEALHALSSLPFDTNKLKSFTDYIVKRSY